ncbi:MAG: polynucleotide adenylyltransferase [Oscillospiraceae bacterium]|nr:polynucleotide adenylyltransferase [Oscillospiraceae bacterium]
MNLPDYVKNIINLLQSAGHEAYAVGGCVRDMLLGLEPADYDITTSATPAEMKQVFAEFSTHDTGLKHGTITVMSPACRGGRPCPPENSPVTPVEVTTFRIDGDYTDNRRPDTVEFTRNLKDDLSRRDFTINAMAYSEKTGIIDYFNGQEDLQNKTIRAVGDPHKRFNEDALRIIRAYRFSAVYGFSIEPETAKAAEELRHLIHNISGERIAQELNKIVTAHFKKDKVDSLALFFLDLNYNEEKTRRILRKLKYDNDTFYKVITLIKHHDLIIEPDKINIKTLLNKFGEEMFFRLAERNVGDAHPGVPPAPNKTIEIAKSIIENGECYSLKQLNIKGGDLVELGYKGREIGEKLNELLQMVINEKCENDREKLLYVINGHWN